MTQGQPPETPPPDLGPFEPVRLLGKGGMGAVYLARDPSLERPTAVKTLLPQHASDDDIVSRFMREARAAARLNHPNICQVYSVGETSAGPYIAMEYVEGVSLDQLIRTQGPLPWQRATAICGQAASALALAHKNGIIHRDIKPANLLIDAQGRCRVTDFGVAKVVEEAGQLTTHGVFIGTPQYMSPEQCGMGTVGPASDLFSLGVTFYEMLTGTLPFGAGTPAQVIRRVTMEPPAPIGEVMPGIPEPVQAVVMKLLEKDAQRRYPNAGALMADLNRLRSGQPPLTRAPRAATPNAPTVALSRAETQAAARKKRRWWVPVAAAGAVLVLLVLAGAAVRRNRGDHRQARQAQGQPGAGTVGGGAVAPMAPGSRVADEVFLVRPGLDDYQLLPIGWVRGGDTLFLAGFKPGGHDGAAAVRLAAASLATGKVLLGERTELPQHAVRFAREHAHFTIAHGPAGSLLESAILVLRPIVENRQRRVELLVRPLTPGPAHAEAEVQFAASPDPQAKGQRGIFAGDCTLATPKGDGHTVALAVSPQGNRGRHIVERDLTDRPLSKVGPPLTPPGAPIVAMTYDPPGRTIAYARAEPGGTVEIALAPADRPQPHRNEVIWNAPGAEAVLAFHPRESKLAWAIMDGEGHSPRLFVCSFGRLASAGEYAITELGAAWIAAEAWDGKGRLYAIEQMQGVWQAMRYEDDGMTAETLPFAAVPIRERLRSGAGIWVSPRGPWAVARMPGHPPGELAAMRIAR